LSFCVPLTFFFERIKNSCHFEFKLLSGSASWTLPVPVNQYQ
jgi:hypothetical protein